MVVQHNLTAMNANRYLGINNSKLSKSLEKLSSGYAINRAGDNAAGLAVSEKMRSQIAGMTQAVKNSQDGISMVQTFEGALTETDSILQRMKTLADQMANGTYDDPVDRTAAQQEFLQLNDELDQIADTDFNGVVVLNGGVMADGTKADKSGLINYKGTGAVGGADAIDEEEVEPKKLGADQTANIEIGVINNKALNKLKDADKSTFTLNEGTDKTTDKDDSWEKTVGYVYDKDKNEWFCSEDETLRFKSNENGGFIGMYGDTINIKNATDVEDGDYVAVKYVIGGDDKAAQFPVTSDGAKVTLTNNATIEDGSKFTIASADELKKAVDGTELTDSEIDKLIAKVGAMDETTITFTLSTTDGKVTHDLKGTTDVTAKTIAGGVNTTMLAEGATTTFTADNIHAVGNEDGTVDFYYALDATGTAATAAAGTTSKAVKIGTLKVADMTQNGTTAGTVKFTLHVSQGKAAEKATVSTDIVAGTANKGLKDKLTAALNGAGGDDNGSGSDYKVSMSNAFNKSEAKMTYKDSITLQAGARTKDAVNFTFKYASTAIGDLKADLNCTAKGLGTDKLNLNTQEAANYAIDKIDQAINKVSLVRGTFGAIQNRLEHKIDNLNVSVENLTSAESQIRDTNMPQEMMNFTKQQILAQASQSMLAQANQLPQGVLSLLQ